MGLATSMENAKILRAFGKARRKYNAVPVNSRKNVVIFFANGFIKFYRRLAQTYMRARAMLRVFNLNSFIIPLISLRQTPALRFISLLVARAGR